MSSSASSLSCKDSEPMEIDDKAILLNLVDEFAKIQPGPELLGNQLF